MMNKPSTRKHLLAGSLIAIFLFAMISVSHRTSAQESTPSNGSKQTAKPAANNPSASNGSVARGRYIVEEVAYCKNCHTPRLPNGQFDTSQWLQGSPLFFQPAHPVADWPIVAPRIGGTPPATDAEMVTLLTTAIWTNGKPLRDPMPKFHMTREDAEAVIAYLKSLKSGQ